MDERMTTAAGTDSRLFKETQPMRLYKKHGNELMTMTRERMIFDLIRNELEWLVENNLPSNIHGVSEFFASGGFDAFSDEQLERAHDRAYPADEVTA